MGDPVIRGLDDGIKRQVAAKLRERGFTESAATRVAEDRLKEARAFFDSRLAAHPLSGKSAEMSLDESFEDLAKWAEQLPMP
jgi:hypothetical protein